LEIHLRSSHIEIDDTVREHVERRLQSTLARFGSHIQRVRVKILDINGPRGGKDKCCRIELRMLGAPSVFVEDTDADLLAVVDRATDRAGRAVARLVERARDHRERTPAPAQAEDRDKSEEIEEIEE